MSKPVFTWPVRVYYEDTDATGVVYHANYLRYFERARTEWLRALGVAQQELRGQSGVVFTLANLEVDYLRPARLDDDLLVTVAVEHLRRASLTFSQAVHLRNDPDAPLARARARVACVDEHGFRPCPLPDDFVQKVSNGVFA